MTRRLLKFTVTAGLLTASVLPSFSVAEKSRTPTYSEVITGLINSMIKVEGGEFAMGSVLESALPRELPVHRVTLNSFYIQQTEVTQAQFQAVMGWNLSYFPCADCPVNNLSWTEMAAYIAKLNTLTGLEFRFLTEAEWEYAARGGRNQSDYRYSGGNVIDAVAWYAGNAGRKIHPVAQKKANELGLYDMTGNVWEFVLDDMSLQAYRHTSGHNPIYRAGRTSGKTLKVLRGSGYEFSAKESDVFKRDGATSNVRLPDVGFRLAMDAEE